MFLLEQRKISKGSCATAARYHGDIHRAFELRAETIVGLFQSADAWRRPERFTHLLQACTSDARGRTGHEQDAYPQADYLLQLLEISRAVDAGKIAEQCDDSNAIAGAIQQARISAVAERVRHS